MDRKRFFLCFAAAGLACNRAPESYPPPSQRAPVAPASAALSPYIEMKDPRADWYLLEDIAAGPEPGGWRWGFRRPRLRFFLARREKLEFQMQFAIAGTTFAETGPVTIRVSVNGKRIGAFRYDSPGDKSLAAKVPPDVVKPGAPNEVVLEQDKLWISKSDGAALSFILVSAGFVEK